MADGISSKTCWMRTALALTVLVVPLLVPHGASAQGAAGQAPPAQPVASAPSASELAKQAQNPIASLISFPLEGNWDMGVGDREATSTLLNIQPVIPFPASKSTNVILRVIMPLMSQPSAESDSIRNNGFGDILLSTFLTPAKPGRVMWGVGPVVLLPAATNDALGAEKFGLGPTVVLLTQPGPWTFGLLANQVWSVSGANDREDVNRTYLQPFTHYNLGGGLSVGASAELTGNWKADNETWSGPLLFDMGKVTKLGPRPVKLRVAAGPWFGPEAVPDWRFRFSMYFLFPR